MSNQVQLRRPLDVYRPIERAREEEPEEGLSETAIRKALRQSLDDYYTAAHEVLQYRKIVRYNWRISNNHSHKIARLQLNTAKGIIGGVLVATLVGAWVAPATTALAVSFGLWKLYKIPALDDRICQPWGRELYNWPTPPPPSERADNWVRDHVESWNTAKDIAEYQDSWVEHKFKAYHQLQNPHIRIIVEERLFNIVREGNDPNEFLDSGEFEKWVSGLDAERVDMFEDSLKDSKIPEQLHSLFQQYQDGAAPTKKEAIEAHIHDKFRINDVTKLCVEYLGES